MAPQYGGDIVAVKVRDFSHSYFNELTIIFIFFVSSFPLFDFLDWKVMHPSVQTKFRNDFKVFRSLCKVALPGESGMRNVYSGSDYSFHVCLKDFYFSFT